MTTNLEPVQTFKILIIGDSSVGKSSLMNRFVHGVFNSQYTATIGVDFQVAIVLMGEYKCRLQIWDTAGQERYRSVTSGYYRGADGIMIVYDVTNSASFNQIKTQISEMEGYCDKSIPMILIGNKDDYSNEMKKVISTDQALEYARQNNFICYETSVKDNKNVTEAFNQLATLVLQRRIEQSKLVGTNASGTRIEARQTEGSATKKKCCTA